MKLLWVMAVFILVITVVFMPVVKIFTGLALGAQDTRLYSEAQLIATASGALTSEGSSTTIEVSIPSGRIMIGRGYVEAHTSRGEVKRFEANVDGNLNLTKGKHILLLEYRGSVVEMTLGNL